jgi:hypothetical protein
MFAYVIVFGSDYVSRSIDSSAAWRVRSQRLLAAACRTLEPETNSGPINIGTASLARLLPHPIGSCDSACEGRRWSGHEGSKHPPAGDTAGSPIVASQKSSDSATAEDAGADPPRRAPDGEGGSRSASARERRGDSAIAKVEAIIENVSPRGTRLITNQFAVGLQLDRRVAKRQKPPKL